MLSLNYSLSNIVMIKYDGRELGNYSPKATSIENARHLRSGSLFDKVDCKSDRVFSSYLEGTISNHVMLVNNGRSRIPWSL